MREITVATVQMKPEPGQMEENLIKMSEFITRIATEQPVDLIIFPELITKGYEMGPRFPDMAQRVPGPTVNLIAQRASELGVHVAEGLFSPAIIGRDALPATTKEWFERLARRLLLPD